MQLTKHWAAHLDDYAIDLAWSPVAEHVSVSPILAAASSSGPVSLFASADGKKLHELPGHPDGTNCLAWAPLSGSQLSAPSLQLLLATGGQDGSVKFWDALAGQHTATAPLGRDWVDHLCWVPRSDISHSSLVIGHSPAPFLLAASGRNLTALRADATVAHTYKPAAKTITALAAPRQGGCVAAAHFGGIQLWDTDDFLLQKEFPYANGIHALVWSPDQRWLVSGNQDPSVHLWIPEKDIELHMSGYETKVKHLSYDYTSRWLATSGGRDACIWDCSGEGPEGREPAMLPHEAPICALAYQNAHGLLATAAQDGTVQLWSPERPKPLRATVKMPAPATKLAWSPDDRLLAIGSEKGVIYVLKCEA
jgi:WD40 repeat protein